MPDHINLFIHIRSIYGIESLKIIRLLENSIKKLCRSKQQLTFLHRCRKNDVIPKCLRVKPLVKTFKGKQIASHTEYKFLQAGISEQHHRILILRNCINNLYTQVKFTLDSNVFQILEDHLNVVERHISQKSKLQLIKKFKQLTFKSISRNNISWVINKSSRILNNAEIELLSKGLNFAPTIKCINPISFIAPIEEAITHLPPMEADNIRQEISYTLRYRNSQQENLLPVLRHAITSLRDDKSIIILPADKGKAVVILNHIDYNKKMMDLLNDQNTYDKLLKDPTSSTQVRMNNMLLDMKKSKKLDDKLYFHLHCSSGVIPRIYGLPKIHKNDIPLRPIVAYYTSPTYNLSKFLSNILSPYGLNQYSIKTTMDFIAKIKRLVLKPGEVMVSFDVVSLFTCIPTEVACDLIKKLLDSDSLLKERTKLDKEDIIRLLNLCLKSNCIQYNGQIYSQKFGTAMGSPISPLIANIVMSDIESFALNAFHPLPSFWCRYIDDIFCVIQETQKYDFLNFINSINPHIKFTMEEEISKTLPFLDCLVTRNSNNKLTTTVYRKPTHTDRYLDFNSNHPNAHKASVIKTLFKRARDISNVEKDKKDEEEHIIRTLENNNYPKYFINRHTSNNHKNLNSDKENHLVKYACIPYIKGTSEKIKRILGNHNIGTSLKPYKVLRGMLCHPKDKIDTADKPNVVYSIACKNCDKKYVGQTSKQLRERVNEHKKNVAKGESNLSAVADHVHTSNHEINWDKTEALHQNTSLKQRLLLESWEFNKNSTFKKNKVSKLPDAYRVLLK